MDVLYLPEIRKEKDSLGVLGICGRMLLKWFLKARGVRM
jgi:hypothetical protein